jgi:hypothetical protein
MNREDLAASICLVGQRAIDVEAMHIDLLLLLDAEGEPVQSNSGAGAPARLH